MKSRRLAGLLLFACMLSAQAQGSYPTQAIRWLLPGPPGSPPDLAARIVSEPLGAALGQAIVIENRPGAGGTIALTAVARAAPDGHTLGAMGINHAVAPALLPQVPYDSLKDLAPVTQLVSTANVLVVSSVSKYKSVSDVVSFAKANPGRVQYSSAGNATPSHLAAELFRIHAGIDARHIPFKGPPAAVGALLGEHVDIAFVGVATAVSHVKSGKLRALGTPSPVRLAALPDVPTMAELGYAGFEVRDWIGVVAPAGTPNPIVGRLAAEIGRILSSADVRQRLAVLGMEPAQALGAENFATLIRAELPRWAKVVRDADIRAD